MEGWSDVEEQVEAEGRGQRGADSSRTIREGFPWLLLIQGIGVRETMEEAYGTGEILLDF
jgi:hypothetical protein